MNLNHNAPDGRFAFDNKVFGCSDSTKQNVQTNTSLTTWGHSPTNEQPMLLRAKL